MFRVDHEADGHHFHTVRAQRCHVLAIGADRFDAGQSHHQRLARTVDVCIQQAHLGALRGPGECQIGGGGGFSDTALAGGDRDHVFDVGQRFQRPLNGVRGNLRTEFQLELCAPQSRLEVRAQRRRQFRHIIGAGEPQYEFDCDNVAADRDRPDRLGFAQGLA